VTAGFVHGDYISIVEPEPVSDLEPSPVAGAAIAKGRLTYEAEGMEGGRYHSRILHVPGESSGLTIGRGYDMKEKTPEKIEQDLLQAGVDAGHARVLTGAAGLSGEGAKQFIQEHDLSGFEISMAVQQRLFVLIYAELEKDVIRICNKADCVRAYGAVDWPALDARIRDVLVDLRFRGDYHPASRMVIQMHVAHNDLASFSACIEKRDNWTSVPEDRFNRRRAYLNT